MNTVSVERLIEEGRLNGFQKLMILGTALPILMYGFDNQLLAFSASMMMQEWQLPRSAFETPMNLSLYGVMIGALFGGLLGDRIGRRLALLSSVILFGTMTLAAAGVTGIPMLGWARLISGLGFGGAIPNAVALAYEFVPRRNRVWAVVLTMSCLPIGGTAAGYVAFRVLPASGWRGLFLLGGTLSIVLGLILFKVLLESPRYLATRRERRPTLIALLRKLGHAVSSDVAFVESEATKTTGSRASLRDLFGPTFQLDIVGLFGAFFACVLATTIVPLSLPATFRTAGYKASELGIVLSLWNLGGLCGVLVGAFIVQRFGSRTTLLGMSAASLVCATFMTAVFFGPRSTLLFLVWVVFGGCVNAVQTIIYALAAHVFPTEVRASGIGMALTIGRIGNFTAGYMAGFSRDQLSGPMYFAAAAIAMTVTLGFLALIRRHIPTRNQNLIRNRSHAGTAPADV